MVANSCVRSCLPRPRARGAVVLVPTTMCPAVGERLCVRCRRARRACARRGLVSKPLCVSVVVYRRRRALVLVVPSSSYPARRPCPRRGLVSTSLCPRARGVLASVVPVVPPCSWSIQLCARDVLVLVSSCPARSLLVPLVVSLTGWTNDVLIIAINSHAS